MGRKEDFQ